MTRAPLPHPPLSGSKLPPLPDGYARETQPRLKVGSFRLVPSNDGGFALPGGGMATRQELAVLAHWRGWLAPELYHVVVTRRKRDSSAEHVVLDMDRIERLAKAWRKQP